MKKRFTRFSPSFEWQPKSARQRLIDVIEHAQSVKALLARTSLPDFLESPLLQKAACFDLLCVSEGTTHLLKLDADIAKRNPHVQWRRIADIGNVLRHEYGRIDVETVWNAVTQGNLDDLLKVVVVELERF